MMQVLSLARASSVRRMFIAALLLALLPAGVPAAAAEELIYKVKWKDREFHLVASVPYRMNGDPMNENLFAVVEAATAVAPETHFSDTTNAVANLNLAVKAAKLMPAKASPEALRAKFIKAMRQADPEGMNPEFHLSNHLLDTALVIRGASAPFPAGSMAMGTDNLMLIRALFKKKPVLPLLNITEYYESFAPVSRATIETFINVAADAMLEPEKGKAWKAAHARCYAAQRDDLPTPAHNACVRDLIQKAGISEAWLHGFYDQRNPLLVDKLLATAEKQERLVASLNHVHLGGQAGVLALLRQRGASFERIHGGPPRK